MPEETHVQEPQADPNVVTYPDVDLFPAEEDTSATDTQETVEEQEVQETQDAEPSEEVEAQEPAEEEPKPEETQLPEAIQRAYADIQRRDAQLRQHEQSYKDSYKAAEELKTLKDKLKSNPAEALELAGGDASSLVDAMLGPDPESEKISGSPVVKKLMKEIEGLKTNHQKYTQEQQQRRIQQEQVKAYNEYTGLAQAQTTKEKYPIVSAFSNQAPQTMFQMAAVYAQQTQKVPDPDLLAKETNNLLTDQAKDVVSRLAELPDNILQEVLQGKFVKAGAAPVADIPKKKTKTLTNRMSSEPPAMQEKPDLVNADPDDVVAAAMAAYKGALVEEE